MWFNRWVHRETGAPPFWKGKQTFIKAISLKTYDPTAFRAVFFYFPELLIQIEQGSSNQ
jgi:hypothetical protein